MITVSLPLDKSGLARLLPHSGDMVLLDTIEDYGAEHIVCSASSHTLLANPLREADRLPAAAALEYAAQAMAAHSALVAQEGPPRRGFIVVVSAVRWSGPWLDAAGPVLRIEAKRTASLGDGAQYAFDVSGGDVSVTGTLTLSLEAETPTQS